MTLGDIGFWVSVAATVIGAGYAALAYHHPKGQSVSPSSGERRPIWPLVVLVLVSWGAVGFDYYDRHFATSPSVVIVHDYGISPSGFSAIVNSEPLGQYKNEYRLVLIARIDWASIDPMTDTKIARSAPYTITGEEMPLSIPFPLKTPILGSTTGSNILEFTIVALPSRLSPDIILSLSDIEKFGGKIVARTRQTIDPFPSASANPPVSTLPIPKLPNTPGKK